ncbi:hypothetical protein [Clostridium oceanicum]|uniref:Uncharacterized protein n=1 Tax=Clostridium oceanicum TaxID=1543 RepID=A0ABN1JJN6_9CLOT
MSGNRSNSLNEAIKALGNVIKDLFRKMPILFFGFIAGVYWIINMYFNTVEYKQFILCLLILIVSIAIYVKNKSISETMLTFMLGILTVFSVDWEQANFKLFIVFYLVFTLMIFIIGSISLSIKQESILVQAANYLSIRHNYDEIYKEVKNIANKSTLGNQLGPIEKAEAIRAFAFRKININDMEEGVKSVEIIKTVCQIDLYKACELFYSLYIFSRNYRLCDNHSRDTINLFDKILTIPVSPEQFFEIFRKTKKKIRVGQLTFDEYVEKIDELANDGMDSFEIIEELIKVY